MTGNSLTPGVAQSHELILGDAKQTQVVTSNLPVSAESPKRLYELVEIMWCYSPVTVARCKAIPSTNPKSPGKWPPESISIRPLWKQQGGNPSHLLNATDALQSAVLSKSS